MEPPPQPPGPDQPPPPAEAAPGDGGGAAGGGAGGADSASSAEPWAASVLRQIGLTFRRAREAIVHIATAADRELEPDAPVTLLGVTYTPSSPPSPPSPPSPSSPPAPAPAPAPSGDGDGAPPAGGGGGEGGEEGDGPDGALDSLLLDFYSRAWLTYRVETEPFGDRASPAAAAAARAFVSDVGWGCMVRSGQMLLANALLTLHLGREWRASRTPSAAAPDAPVLALFADVRAAPFSLQRVTAEGEAALGTRVGQWYGPAAICASLSRLLGAVAADAPSMATAREYVDRVPEARRLAMHVAMDGVVCLDDVAACAGAGWPRAVLLLCPLRLGLPALHRPYAPALARLLRLEQCAGMLGGRPRRSFYFVGVQGSAEDARVLYLDPHTHQPALGYAAAPPGARWPLSSQDVRSCHCEQLRLLPLVEIDPSLALGFLIRSARELDEWADAARAICADGPPFLAFTQSSPPANHPAHQHARAGGGGGGGGGPAAAGGAPAADAAEPGSAAEDEEDDDIVFV